MLSKTSILVLLSSLMINAAPLAEPDASDSNSSAIPLYYQCGGSNWTGATQCVDGATCVSQNEYYYQCVATSDSGDSNNSVAATTTAATSNTVETSDAEAGSLANTASVAHEKQDTTTYAQTATEDTSSSEVLQSSTVQKTTLSTFSSVLSTKAGSNAVKTAASVSTTISSVASSASAASSSSSASSDSSSSPDIKTVSGGFSGSTEITRYWDCCAPSFCWEGKSNSTSGRVAVCDSNGDTLQVDGNNFQSGCVGGKAYMCADQVPWAINDNLAYGFAAASVIGASEDTLACACFKLTFTSTSIKGKQMIVQITNTGGGTHMTNNAFDLALPASGFGEL
ncbi:unnamed protein product [Ambrosiozyma monospora]|uniref:cellulase n=1 Tax=Ambrosiozyma monospora TaxID=43982 RepID=A0A9W6YRD7_AMBMO|nr:unnamed protein product [Ambrosiozyma monospora]